MNFEIPPLFYALGATLSFAYSSTIFTEFSRKTSPFWMNTFKATVALIAFWITALLYPKAIFVTRDSIISLFSSGLIGLMIGDIFMLHAMKELGASRMLMIFGLQPFFLGLGGYYFFGQHFSTFNFLGIVFMTICLYVISLESYKKSGSWQLKGMILGLIAILFDGAGIFLTRYGFDQTPGLSSPLANGIRCIGALAGFVIINYFIYPKKNRISFFPTWQKLTSKERWTLILGSLGGTFISLMLYLIAVSKGQLSVVSSVSATGPMFAGLFECLINKRLPNKYLITAFVFFVCGFYVFSQLI